MKKSRYSSILKFLFPFRVLLKAGILSVRQISRKIGLIFLLIFCVLYPVSFAHSAIILKVKGRKALVDLEGVQAEKGDKFDALNLYGKPLGVLQIKKVKKGKAIAVLIKGKMGVNWILEPSAPDSSGSSSFAGNEEYNPPSRDNNNSSAKNFSTASSFQQSAYSSNGFGIILGPKYSIVTTAPSNSISGLSFIEQLLVDFSFVGPLGARIMLGHQELRATGSSCGLSSCQLSIHYIGAGFLLRGIFLRHSMFQPWLGAGGRLLWPFVNQKADLGLDKKSFSSFHGAVTGSIGIDIHFGGIYIPIQIDVSWINPVLISLQSLKEGTRDFKPLYISAKLGVAFAF